MSVKALLANPAQVPFKPQPQISWLQRFQVSWQEVSPLKRTLCYGALGCTTTCLMIFSTPFFQRRGYFENSISLSHDVFLIPIVEEIISRGFVCSFIETLQRVVHRRMYKNQPPTQQQLASQTTLRVNLQAALFALEHSRTYGPTYLLLTYGSLGRATGYLFESRGLPQAILCHIGHNLVSYVTFTFLSKRIPHPLAMHFPYYAFIFWGVLKKPILPLPSSVKQKSNTVYDTIANTLSAACQKGWRCFRRIFRC